MSKIKELKKRLNEDKEFRNKFSNIKNEEEAIFLAKQLGFNIKKEDLENDPELSEDVLSAVAGGKGKINFNGRKEEVYVFGDNCNTEVITRKEYNKRGGT